jgi:uracil-DNA glycosylase
MTNVFPFGQPLKRLSQADRTPKKVFVLGVYASAVHARWVDKNGKQLVAALAVASEPEIFWRGRGAKEIIEKIVLPEGAGTLTVPLAKELNGPSGNVLDEKFLRPLRFTREDAWLCDLLPESRVNERQREAIDKHYNEKFRIKFNLSKATVPNFKKSELNSKERREEILQEIRDSKAKTLVLLGDLPIQWFLRYYTKEKYSKLSQFGDTQDKYGKPHEMEVAGIKMTVIPLCHPRQAGKLGASSEKWGRLHKAWVKERTGPKAF